VIRNDNEVEKAEQGQDSIPEISVQE